MSDEKRDIVAEAIQDAKRMKDTAIANAKNILTEQLSARVNKLVTEAIEKVSSEDEEEKFPPEKDEGFDNGMGGMREAEKDSTIDLDELPPKKKTPPPSDEDEGDVEEAGRPEGFDKDPPPLQKKLNKKDIEDKALEDAFQPQVEEVSLDDDDLGEAGFGSEEDEDEKVEKEAKDEGEEEPKVKKDVEFSEAEIEEAYKEIFKEVEVPPLDGKLSREDHAVDTDKKEKHFDQEEAPEAKDFFPKEAYYRKALRNAGVKIMEYRRVIQKLSGAVNEVNLLNMKLLATTRLNKLTESREAKERVINVIDKAKTVGEVKRFEAGIREFVSQKSKGFQKSPLNRSSSNALGTQRSKTITEGNNPMANRFKVLAGIAPRSEDTEEK